MRAHTHYYPILLDLREREVVVVGGGPAAEEKCLALLEAGARVTLVAPEVTPRLAELAGAGTLRHLAREYRPGDLAGAFLALGTLRDEEINGALRSEAEERRVPLNVLDVPPLCSFIAPSVLRRGDLILSISTSGRAPALAVRLRQRLGRLLGDEYARFLALAGRLRAPLQDRFPGFVERRRRWYELVDSEVLDLLRRGEEEAARRRAVEIMGVEPEATPAPGGV